MTFLIGLMLGSAAPPPPVNTDVAPAAAKAAPSVPFEENDPAYAELNRLMAVADKLDEADDKDTTKVRAANEAVIAAGMKVKVRGTNLVHPGVGKSLVYLAYEEQIAGNNAKAEDYAKRGLEVLRHFRDYYPNNYIQAISLIGYLRSGAGQPAEAATALAEGVAYAEGRLARSKDLNATDYMAASNMQYAYADVLQRLGQSDRAVEMQRHSLNSRVTGLGADNPDAIAARYGLAMIMFRAGRPDEAEAVARDAVARAIAHVPTTHTSYARSLEALGLILSRNGKRAEALDYLRRSLEIKRANGAGGTRNYLGGLQNLGTILVQLERYDEADRVFGETVAGYDKIDEGRPSSERMRVQAYRGLAQFAGGQRNAGVTTLEAAYTSAHDRDANEREVGIMALPALVVGYVDQGKVADARARAAIYRAQVGTTESPNALSIANADALVAYADLAARPAAGGEAVAAAHRIVNAVADNQSLTANGELPQPERTALDLVLRIAVVRGDAALALDAMTVLAGSRIAQANHLLAERLVSADPKLAEQVRAYQDRTRAFQAADVALLRALASGKDVDAARVARDAALAGQTTARATLTRDYPRWAEASASLRLPLAAVQAGLGPDEAMLGVISAFDGVYTLAVDRGGASIGRTALPRADLVKLIDRLRNSLPTGQFDTAASHELYAQIFTPANTARLGRAGTLRIVATGPLAAVPFATLLERPVAKVDRGAPWLVKRFALHSTPGFAPTPAIADGVRTAGFLGVGDPAPFGGGTSVAAAAVGGANRYFRGGGVDVAALSALPRLTDTAQEIRAVADRLGARDAVLLTGTGASEEGLRKLDLTRFSTLLFATHGLVSGEMEGVAEPSLVLAPPAPGSGGDGLLTASEISGLKLAADWVILSACNTAAGSGEGSPAYSGLAQAFRYAGARALLLSHWPVRDDAATAVTVATVAGARRGLSRPKALRQGMLKLMASRTVAGAADPYIWAPYVLMD